LIGIYLFISTTYGEVKIYNRVDKSMPLHVCL